MAQELERMIVSLLADVSGYTAGMQQAVSQAQRATASLQGLGTSAVNVSGSFQGLASVASSALGQLAGGITAAGGLFRAIGLASATEQAEISFQTMLGSAEKGTAMLASLIDFAAKTPLQLTDVQQAARTLLQFGTAGEEVIGVMRMIGDTVGGDAERFQRMSLAFGQMQSAGRLMGQDLLQMINAGFNPLQEISRTTGKSVSELKAQMEKGNITVKMVTDAFKSATAAGGKFFDLMARQSQTAGGLFSTMKDDIDGALRAIGKDLIEGLRLKEAMQAISAFAQKSTQWMAIIPPEIKGIATAVGVLAAAAGTATLAWSFLGGAITTSLSPLLGFVGIAGTALAGLKVALVALGAAIVHPLATGQLALAALGSAFTAAKGVITAFASMAAADLLTLRLAISQAGLAASALSFVAWGGALALAAGAAYGLYVAVSGLKAAQAELNTALERGKKLSTELTALQKKQAEGVLKDAANITDPGARKDFLTAELARAQKELTGYQASVRGSQRAVDELGKSWITWMGWGAEPAKQQLADATAQAEAAKGQVQALQAELDKLGIGDKEVISKALADDVKKFTANLTLAVRTIGLTSQEADLMKLKLQGATDAMLGNARGLIQMAEAAKAIQSVKEGVKDFTKDLQVSLATMGMSADQARLFKLEMDAAATGVPIDPAKLANIRGMIEMKKDFEEAKKLADQGRQVTKDLATPQEKYASRIAELQKLLDAGAISQDIYSRGVDSARKTLEEATGAARAYATATRGIEGVAYGSAEALSRYDAYREAFSPAMSSTGREANESLQVQKQMRDLLQKIADEPGIDVEEGAFSDVGF